ncbi:methyltransferase domain-containing protein, partial [Candidatus Parcubacteria bacterium]
MSFEEAQERVKRFFQEKLETYGPSAKGVDYNSDEAQIIRFEQLVRVIDPSRPFSIIDYGCGYGALFDFLQQKGWQFDYYGVDLVEKMIEAARELHHGAENAHFTTDESELPRTDYLVAGAIFNMKLETPRDEWQELILSTLHRMDALCTKGFSFNML